VFSLERPEAWVEQVGLGGWSIHPKQGGHIKLIAVGGSDSTNVVEGFDGSVPVFSAPSSVSPLDTGVCFEFIFERLVVGVAESQLPGVLAGED
jgi:hypothetical protein